MFSRSVTVTVLLCLSFLTGVAANAAPRKGDASSPVKATLPEALRPALYQTLARDAGPAYAVGKNDCASVPDQRLTACFDQAGIHFRRRGRQLLTLALAGFGRGTQLRPVTLPAPSVRDNTVTYHARALTAWWRVLPAGFEEGFTIAHRPAGSAPLHLVLTASASSAPTHRADQLAWGALRYGDLVVTDAAGKVVPSNLTTENGRIIIAVNDAHARYPLSVDPLVSIEQKITASDSTDAISLGWSVAISGTTALVGVPRATVGGNLAQGTVYVFTESDGTWTQTAELTASDGAAHAFFGWSVALSGATALVGSGGGQGTAYVFTESGGTWTQTAELTPSGGETGGQLGYPVALSGTTAVVGSPSENGSSGAVYVFTESGGTWTQTAELTVSGSYELGYSVAVLGTTIFADAPYAAVGGNPSQGAVYVFSESGGTWTQTAELTASDGAAYGIFGYSVALAGTTALVGALGGDGGVGAAYVFTESGGIWTQATELVPSDGVTNDEFGLSVALDGTTALIGSNQFPSGGPGAAYLFEESGGTWTQTAELTASDGAAGDQFGYSVALAGTTALVGAPFATVGGIGNQGAAYFYGESDLGFVVSAPATVNQGAQYVSQTIATNNASSASPAVAVTITVPAAASFIGANASQGDCAETSGVVTCDLGAVAGNGGTATANVTLSAVGNVGDLIENTASVSHATPALTASAPTTITSGLQAQIQPPIDADGSSVFKANRGVVPVKFTLTSDGEPTCDLPPATIAVQQLSGGSPGDVDEDDYETNADDGSNFRIDSDACQYVYNLSAQPLGPGTYEVEILINGTTVGSATFGLQ